MKVQEIIKEVAPVVFGAVAIMRLLAAGRKATPIIRTHGEKLIQQIKTNVFKGKRLYANPKQAQQLDKLSKEASDIKNMISKLKAKQENPKLANKLRKELERVEQEMAAVMKQVAKNKKRDMEMF